MGEHKLLLQVTVLANILCSFHLYVSAHTIILIVEVVAKVDAFLHPRKGVTTQEDTGELSFCFQKCDTFGLTFYWVRVRTKFQVVIITIVFNRLHHFSQSIKGGGQHPVVVAVAEHAVVVVIHPATSRFLPEDLEHIVHIKTVEDSAKYRSLTDAIAEGEDTGVAAVPTNIGILEDVDDDEDPDVDLGKSFLE